MANNADIALEELLNPLKFSVVIPTYNRVTLLAQCLAAVTAQSYSNYEVIVADDGSPDHTHEMVRYRFASVRYLRQDNRGPAAARNLGIRQAQGEIITFTDDDCLVPPHWLEALARGYQRHPQVVGVGGYLEAPDAVLANNIFAQYERYNSYRTYGVGDVEYVGGFECPAGGTNNMSYRRAALEEIGGFDESFPVAGGEDADLKWRLHQQGHSFLYLPLKVTHLHPYSWRSFRKQSYNHGKGRTYFERKHGGQPSRLKIALRLAWRFVVFPIDLTTMKPRALALAKLAHGLYGGLGQWAALERKP